MEKRFQIVTDSSCDLPQALADELDLAVLPLHVLIGEHTYANYLDGREIGFREFYDKLRDGERATTSAVNVSEFTAVMEEKLKAGLDILFIGFSSGLSTTYQSGAIACGELREKYPERKLVVIDSLCSSSGYGLLVDGAADLRDAGKSMDEIADWTMAMRQNVHHQFYSTELKFYRRSGRMSGAAAAIGTVLGICPIMRLDDKGRIIAYDKVRGKKNAVARTVETMKRHAQGGVDYAGKAFICHSNCLSDALATKAAVEAAFPHLDGEVRICDIGTIVASHSGPGTVAVFFFGDARAPEGDPV